MVGRAKRRDRRMARAIRRERQFRDHVQAESTPESREGLQSSLLCDQPRISADAGLIRKSLRWGALDDHRRGQVIDRLVTLVEKTGVPRLSKEGELIIDEELADKNAIAASSVLVSIEAQQQRDDHLEKRLSTPQRPVPQTTVNVGVNVDNRIDQRRDQTLAIAERVRAGRILPVDSGGGS